MSRHPDPQLVHLPRRLRHRRAAVRRGTVRPCGRAAARVDVRHPVLGRGRNRRSRRRLRSAPQSRHRRRDHGRQQVRPARLAGRPGLEGLVGPEPAVPHTDLRAHPPPAAPDRDGGRHHVPLPRRRPGRGARDRPRSSRWPGRPDRRRRHRRTRLRSPPGSSTTCISSRSRSCSAAASASGTAWRLSRMPTTSRRSPRPAASPTSRSRGRSSRECLTNCGAG